MHLIRRILATGEETPYDDLKEAGRVAMLTPSTLYRTYLDRPRQLRGCHWRTEGSDYWHPPSGLVYVVNKIEKLRDDSLYVQAVTPGGSKLIYESITTAAQILKVDRRALSAVISGCGVLCGVTWTKVDQSECSTMSSQVPGPVVLYPTDLRKQDVRSTRTPKLFAYDLETGEVHSYTSVNDAFEQTGIHGSTIKNTLLDKPRQANSMVFYSAKAGQMWEPPIMFEYEAGTYVKKMRGYVVAEACPGGDVMAVYEGVDAAARLQGGDRHMVADAIKGGKVYKGCHWRAARDDEISAFVPV